MFRFVHQFVQKRLRLHIFFLMLLFFVLSLIPVAAWDVTLSGGDEEIILGVAAGPDFNKSFIPATIGPGNVSTLRFDINNGSADPVIDLAFTDSMPNNVMIATPANVSNSCNGTLTAPDGGTSIILADGDVGGSSSCIITVDVTSSTPGTHTNTSGALTSNAGTGSTPSADLIVDASRPGFSKDFSPSTVDFGGRSTLTFTIDNSYGETASAIAHLSFLDNLPVGMEIADPANASTTCGTSSSSYVPVFTAVSGTSTFSFSQSGVLPNDPAVAAGEDCIVSVDVIATGTGALINSSGELTFDYSYSSGKANATLESSSNTLYLTKSFVADPVPAGGEVDLVFTIQNQNRNFSATNISFTDDLDAVLTGLVALGLPQSDVCGSGSTLSGTSVLTLSGGNLTPSQSCTFTATLQIPANAVAGSYPNMTSNVTATVDSSLVVGTAGSDTLFVAPVPLLTKSFIDDPVASGGDVTLQFNITNSSAISTATDIAFFDELTTFLPFPLSVVFPSDPPCGVGSTISLFYNRDTDGYGISLASGTLAPGASCIFTSTITIPIGLASGSYLNTTSNVTATVDGESLEGNAATDTLEVVSAPTLRKSFLDDPVLAGELVTLEFTIEHGIEEPGGATNIAFTDDLDAVLTGLVAIGLPQNGVCGAGSQISGTDTLSFSGGSLDPGEVCTISVQLQLPTGEILPGKLTNTTSNLTADVLGLAVTGLHAEDDLIIGGLTLTKSFTNDPVMPGETVTLEFMIENESTTFTTTSMSFTDDLNFMFSGLVVMAPLPTEPCGTGSALNDTSSELTFTGGNLAEDSFCTFSVMLQVPASVEDGSYLNITSDFTATIDGNLMVLDPATDNLVIGVPPLYLPLVLNNALFAPDLVVTSLDVSGGNVQIVITNQGTGAVSDSFWVDLYIDPTTVPTMVNQTWQMVSSFGAAWGIEDAAMPLAVGETITLTVNDIYYHPEQSNLPNSISAGTPVYVQVDSANSNTNYGNLLETHEITNDIYNNILGPVSATTMTSLFFPDSFKPSFWAMLQSNWPDG
ncbi:MAG: hypothetical protein GY805_22350 [Chloroflexi bacterium]|nr:hypothetical protein [Chloroflexota bacterium]